MLKASGYIAFFEIASIPWAGDGTAQYHLIGLDSAWQHTQKEPNFYIYGLIHKGRLLYPNTFPRILKKFTLECKFQGGCNLKKGSLLNGHYIWRDKRNVIRAYMQYIDGMEITVVEYYGKALAFDSTVWSPECYSFPSSTEENKGCWHARTTRSTAVIARILIYWIDGIAGATLLVGTSGRPRKADMIIFSIARDKNLQSM